MNETAKKIRDLREDHDLLQDEMADILQCNRGSVSNYENGRNLPMDVIIAYCNYFRVSADWLLGLTTDRQPGGSNLSKQLDFLAKLTIAAGGDPLSSDRVSALAEALTVYYRHGAPAGNLPVQVTAQFLAAMRGVVQAAVDGTTDDLITATNAVVNAGLKGTDIMAASLKSRLASGNGASK